MLNLAALPPYHPMLDLVQIIAICFGSNLLQKLELRDIDDRTQKVNPLGLGSQSNSISYVELNINFINALTWMLQLDARYKPYSVACF